MALLNMCRISKMCEFSWIASSQKRLWMVIKYFQFGKYFCQKWIGVFILQINYVQHLDIYFYKHCCSYGWKLLKVHRNCHWDFCRSLYVWLIIFFNPILVKNAPKRNKLAKHRRCIRRVKISLCTIFLGLFFCHKEV